MLANFKQFGIEHIISIILPIIIGLVFIILSLKRPDKRKIISIILAITIIAIRFVRYGFDIYYDTFNIADLLSLHICNIDLYVLAFCLIKPSRTLFTFVFLVGIPTALSVVLMPGKTHPAPGLLRAEFFIMSHMMLVMGAIYLQKIYNFIIFKKDLLIYYLVALFGIIIIYIFNTLTNANFMYLMEGPKNTVLEIMHSNLGPFLYVLSIYLLLIGLMTLFFGFNRFYIKHTPNLK